jgi:hypothetical protein
MSECFNLYKCPDTDVLRLNVDPGWYHAARGDNGPISFRMCLRILSLSMHNHSESIVMLTILMLCPSFTFGK